MANLFDKRLPKTTTYWIEEEIFFVKNKSFMITLEEGKAMAELLEFAMKEKSTKAVLINNREAGGAWPKEINQLLENNVQLTKVLSNKKMATLTNSATKTFQTNRLSRESGVSETSKTFDSEFNDEVKEFLLK